MSQSKAPQAKSIGTVLVIGGCGFLGSSVIDHLLNFPSEATSTITSQSSFHIPTLKSRYPSYDPVGTQVHGFDLRCVRNLYSGCTYHEGDLTSVEQLLKVFRIVKPDVVINTASPSFDSPKAVLRKVNIEGTRTLVEVAGGKHGDWGGKCKAFIHTSSASVINDCMSDMRNADERWPYVVPNPIEYYSETKVYAERIVLDSNDKDELNHMLTCSVRPAGIIGEGDQIGFTISVLNTASVAPLWQLHIQLGDNTNQFDYTYVHNVVFGLLCTTDALLETYARKQGGRAGILDSEKIDGEVFIVTNDEPGYFWDLTRYVWSTYGKEIDPKKVWALPEGFAYVVGALSELVSYVTGRKGRITRQTIKYSCLNRYFNCEKLKSRTGYVPVVGLEEALVRSVLWYKAQEAQEKEKKGQ